VELAAILGRAWTVGWLRYETNRRVPFGEEKEMMSTARVEGRCLA